MAAEEEAAAQRCWAWRATAAHEEEEERRLQSERIGGARRHCVMLCCRRRLQLAARTTAMETAVARAAKAARLTDKEAQVAAAAAIQWRLEVARLREEVEVTHEMARCNAEELSRTAQGSGHGASVASAEVQGNRPEPQDAARQQNANMDQWVLDPHRGMDAEHDSSSNSSLNSAPPRVIKTIM